MPTAQQLANAKMLLARWADSSGFPSRAKLLTGVEKIFVELPKRSDWREVLTFTLGDSENLFFSATSHAFEVFPCSKGVAISGIVPGWGFGWREILKHEDVCQVLSWLLHYARQYINRSNTVAVLMAIFEETGKVLHPFGTEGMYRRYGPVLTAPSDQSILNAAKQEALDKWGGPNDLIEKEPSKSVWLSINMLDPFLHQAAFQFLRGQQLVRSGFDLEAIVAFDCALESIVNLIQVRSRLAGKPSRKEVLNQLGSYGDSADVADHANFLRNHFGAHAGGWRWWDYGELLEDYGPTQIAAVTGDVIKRAAEFEPRVRAIDLSPAQWHDWLFTNFNMIWETVWFEKLAN